jgi:hypothetical protein
MDALSLFVDRGGARDEQDGQPVEVDAHAARERAGLGIGVGFVQNAMIGHRALFDGRVRDVLKKFSD